MPQANFKKDSQEFREESLKCAENDDGITPDGW
jgi:hypothetical protein